MAQAGTPQAVRALGMERSLPIAWWLPKLGGEDVPSVPLPKAMIPHPLRTIILQELFFQPGCAWWEVLLFLEIPFPDCAGHGRVLPCSLAGGKVWMGIKQVPGQGLWPPGSGSSLHPLSWLSLISKIYSRHHFPGKTLKSISPPPFISMEKLRRKEIQERKAKTSSTNGKNPTFFTMIQQDFHWAPGCRRLGSLADISQPSSLAWGDGPRWLWEESKGFSLEKFWVHSKLHPSLQVFCISGSESSLWKRFCLAEV